MASNSGKNSLMLSQMSYHCPGMHGPESRQRIERRTFGDFMDSPNETGRIVIPLFQRRYCWEDVRVSGWFRDAVGGTRDHLGVHNSGNVVVIRDQESHHKIKPWILIDGQQRMTTTSLLVAALRDACLKEGLGHEDETVKKLEKILYVDIDEAGNFKETDIEEGKDLEFCRLVPSFYDRRPFFIAINEGLGSLSPDHLNELLKLDSLQVRAKRHFDKEIQSRLKSVCGADKRLRQEELKSLTHLTLFKMGLTLAEIMNEINLAQVFLWLQEKTLFGEAALLFNPHPGIDFTASDLIRNLILASVAKQRLSEQEVFYRSKWLNPIECKFANGTELTVKISEFVTKSTEHIKEKHVSKLEETVLLVRKQFPKGRGCLDHAMEYAKFYSFYEWRLRQAAMLPPRVVKKADVGKKKVTNDKKEAEKDLTELVDEQTMLSVTENVLKELTDFVGRR